MSVWAWIPVVLAVLAVGWLVLRWLGKWAGRKNQELLAVLPENQFAAARKEQEQRQEFATAFNDTAREYQDLLGKVTSDDDLHSDAFRADLESQLVKAAVLQAAAPDPKARAACDELVEHMLGVWTQAARSSRLADLYARNRGEFFSAVLKLSSG